MTLTRNHLRRAGTTLFFVLLIALFGFWLSRGKVEQRERTETVDMFDVATPERAPPTPQTQTASRSENVEDIAPFEADAPPFPIDPPAPSNAPPGPPIPEIRGGNNADPYVTAIFNLIRRHLRRDDALVQEAFSFNLSVRVTSASRIEVVNISNVRPPELRAEIARALANVGPASEPPPSGTINPINLQFRQAGQ